MTRIVMNTWMNPDCTLGRLYIGDFQCFTLELPWADNKQGMSCIPAGTYEYFRKNSQNNGWCLQLKDVPDRTLIQLHSGNYTRQILGCILAGDSIKYLDQDKIPDVTNSVTTVSRILALAGESGDIIINRV